MDDLEKQIVYLNKFGEYIEYLLSRKAPTLEEYMAQYKVLNPNK